MKPLLYLLPVWFLTSSTLAAEALQFTVHGSGVAQTNAIVTFQAPKAWSGHHSVTAKLGQSTLTETLQVNEAGQAVIIIPHVGAGETITFTSSASTSSPRQILVKQKNNLLHITQHEGAQTRPILDYQMEAGSVPDGVSEVFKHGAHLHPVYSPSGRVVTGNHPADHRWHRGIWMAWTKTEFEGQHPDFWNQGKGEGKEKNSEQLLAEVRFDSLEKSWSGPVQGGFLSHHRFLDHTSGSTKEVLAETWEVTVYNLGSAYILDLVSTQTCATKSPLHLPQYHYGGLGVRGPADWNPVDKVSMLTSNGDDRAKGDSTKAQWVRMSGEVDGQATGLAILIHPNNFRFPQPLRLNPKNPQLCIAPSQEGDWSIEPGKPYVSRYRFLISDGPADAPALEAAWQAYAHPLKVTIE